MLGAGRSKAEEAGNTQNGDRGDGNAEDGNRDAESTKHFDREVELGGAASRGDAGAVEGKRSNSDTSSSSSASSSAEVRRMSSSQTDPVKHVVGITISR